MLLFSIVARFLLIFTEKLSEKKNFDIFFF